MHKLKELFQQRCSAELIGRLISQPLVECLMRWDWLSPSGCLASNCQQRVVLPFRGAERNDRSEGGVSRRDGSGLGTSSSLPGRGTAYPGDSLLLGTDSVHSRGIDLLHPSVVTDALGGVHQVVAPVVDPVGHLLVGQILLQILLGHPVGPSTCKQQPSVGTYGWNGFLPVPLPTAAPGPPRSSVLPRASPPACHGASMGFTPAGCGERQASSGGSHLLGFCWASAVTTNAHQPYDMREGAPPYVIWALALSRTCCIFSWHDLMTSTSWAKAKEDPISVHTHSSWSHSSPWTSPTLHTARTCLLVFLPKANRQENSQLSLRPAPWGGQKGAVAAATAFAFPFRVGQ